MTYQQAYRFASTQQQYINLRIGANTILIGGVSSFVDFYKLRENPSYSVDNNLFAGNPQVNPLTHFKAENVNSFEIGYKGLVAQKRLLIDMYGYYGIYSNFISRTIIAQSVTGNKSVFTGTPDHIKANLSNPDSVNTYSIPVNVSGDVNTYGFGISLTYSLPHNFAIKK